MVKKDEHHASEVFGFLISLRFQPTTAGSPGSSEAIEAAAQMAVELRHIITGTGRQTWWGGPSLHGAGPIGEIKNQHFSGWWLTYPLKNISSSVGIMTFPIYGKITTMFQTTDQFLLRMASIFLNKEYMFKEFEVLVGNITIRS